MTYVLLHFVTLMTHELINVTCDFVVDNESDIKYVIIAKATIKYTNICPIKLSLGK